ncbi:MAG TPA: VanZ family protein [Chitinophagaceae bacterium]|nr:VanZ family protein [Chitinophagaceae bacterium]
MNGSNNAIEIRTDSRLTMTLFIIYLLGLAWLIVLKFNVAFLWIWEERSLNLIPFSELFSSKPRIDYLEMILNALVFVPFGLYSGALFKDWNFRKHVMVFMAFSFACEVLQYILGVGAADVTDMINNTIGGIAGLLIFKGIEKAFGDPGRARRFINIAATIATVVIIGFLLLLRIKELWLFRMHTIQR